MTGSWSRAISEVSDYSPPLPLTWFAEISLAAERAQLLLDCRISNDSVLAIQVTSLQHHLGLRDKATRLSRLDLATCLLGNWQCCDDARGLGVSKLMRDEILIQIGVEDGRGALDRGSGAVPCISG